MALLTSLPPWRPFLDPLSAHDWWYLFLVPLALGISVTYRAVRMERVDGAVYWRQVAVMTAQIVLAMVLLWVAAFVFLQYVVPLLAPMPE